MINQLIIFLKRIFEGPLSISLFRIIGYNKPYRVALVRFLSIIFKKFRPHYHSIIYEATQSAIKLKLKKISILEFGVASGNGLLSIEKYCKKLSKKYKIEYEIYGFDFGDSAGLNFSKNPKDLPYYWSEGQFKMNYKKLEKKITISKLVLGNVSDTIKSFTQKYKPAPIAVVFFDLDYYTSTVDALELFKCHDEFILAKWIPIHIYFLLWRIRNAASLSYCILTIKPHFFRLDKAIVISNRSIQRRAGIINYFNFSISSKNN